MLESFVMEMSKDPIFAVISLLVIVLMLKDTYRLSFYCKLKYKMSNVPLISCWIYVFKLCSLFYMKHYSVWVGNCPLHFTFPPFCCHVWF